MQSNQLHRSKALENVSIAYRNTDFIADQLSPRVMVANEDNVYHVYSKNFMALPETARADGAESNKSSFDISTASYHLEEHSIHEDITDRQRDNADTVIKLDIDVTEFCSDIILRRREIDLQTIVQTKANWSNTLSLSAALAWSANTTASNPITQIDSVSSAVLTNCGRMPNTIMLDNDSFLAAKEHTSIVDRVKYTSQRSVNEAILANLFNVKTLLRAKGVYNNSEEGLDETNAVIWTDTVFVGFIESAMGLKKLSALGTFWKSNKGAPVMVKKWRKEELSADRIEATAMFENKIISSDCGYLIINTNQ